MNKHQFKIWLEKDHFACFPNVKTFFNKMDQEERNRVYRKWYSVMHPYQEGYAIKASELLMQETDSPFPQEHPALLAAICRRLQPRQRDETLQRLDITEEQREEMRQWPQLYPHIAKLLTDIGEMKDAILLERSKLSSNAMLEKFDREAKERLDNVVETLKKECYEVWEEIDSHRNPSKSPSTATSQSFLTTDTPPEESEPESHPGASMTVMDVESLKQTLIDLDGKEDIAF